MLAPSSTTKTGNLSLDMGAGRKPGQIDAGLEWGNRGTKQLFWAGADLNAERKIYQHSAALPYGVVVLDSK